LRLKLWQNGFNPVPCLPDGKPAGIPQKVTSETQIRSWATQFESARETGILLANRKVVLVGGVDEARAVTRLWTSDVIQTSSKSPIESGLKSGVVDHWAAPVGFNREPRRSRRNGPGRIAAKFLVDYLARGPRPSTDVIEAAQASGISLITLRRAKRSAGVIAEPVRGREQRVASWVWRLGG
jgi:hypothetical protein